jgi:spore maturation protein CgeB
MSIAFFGSSLVSAYWNGAATYYRGILSALAGRGHRITFFEPDAYGRQQHRDIADPPWARVVVYPAEEPAARRALAEAADADLVVKASGVGVFDRLLESGVLALQGPSTLVAFWDVDAPATLDRLAADPGDHLAALIPRYDIVFTYGGGVPVTTAYERLGARCCVPIYNALDPMTHHPVEGDRRFEGALGFLGNRLPDRERRVDELFFAAAARLPSERFLLGGSGWDDRELPANVVRLGHVFTRDHNAFNVSPRAVLNISRDSMAAYGFSPATRVFEAAGAGACLITDAWAGIEEFLEPGREVLVARSGDDVARHVRRISRGEARGIGARARQRVLREHTYDHRALDVEAALGETWRRRRVELPGSRPPPPQRRLDIVILGLSITSSWGNGHATTYRSLVRELDARGHRVLFLERDVPWYAAHRDMPCPAFGRTELYADFDDLVRRFGAPVVAADLVMVGSYVPGGVDIGNWVTRTAGGATAFYDIDTPVTLAALEDGGCDYLSPELISRYDLYLSFTGGPTLERIERQYRAPRALPLYCSVDPIQYHPEERGPRWSLSYMGTYSEDRQPPLAELLLAPARRLHDQRFVVAGPRYPDTMCWPDNVERIEHLPPRAHRRFYNASAFTLNITRRDMVVAGFSPSVRLFEAAACATPIISDIWEGIDTLFTPGAEILLARSSAEVVAHLVETPDEERRAIGERARARVLREHTAAHRAAELESYVADERLAPAARAGAGGSARPMSGP